MALNITSIQYWQKKLYKNPMDPTFETIQIVKKYMTQESVVFDLGAGAGEVNGYNLKGHCKKIIGADFDPRVKTNNLLDEGIILTDNRIPLPDKSVDVIFSIYVFEHIDKPQETVAELNRILKPGGKIIALTPNKYHYVSLFASLTPLKFHKWINKKRGFNSDDTFPTAYKINTPHDIKKHFGSQYSWNFDLFEIQPNYLKFNVIAFLLGVIYERVVNFLPFLAFLRVNMIAVGSKK